MAELATSPRSVQLDSAHSLRISSGITSGSSTSSSGGSASSWERSEGGSAPTSDSESSNIWKSANEVPVSAADTPFRGGYQLSSMAEEQLEARLWSPTSSSASLAPAVAHAHPHSPPHSAGSCSPPDRVNMPETALGIKVQPHGPGQQLGLNSLSPHVEPFSPNHATKYPQTAAYARLLQPSRNDYASGPVAEKRIANENGIDSVPSGATYTSEGPFEAYNGGTAPTSGSASQRDLQPSLSNVGTEEISTIFVVGFPEDLQEREFQNMFIFSPGFEAATLKIPMASPTREREQSQAPRAGVSILAYEQDDESSAAHASRKQIIGFAKFRTRAEAIDARNVLSGRKVDAEKGSVLKAEMAKKNLHTKRGLANDAVSGVGNPTGNASLQSLPALLAGMLQTQALPPGVLDTAVTSLLRHDHQERDARAHVQQASAYDAFHSMAPSGSAYAYQGSTTSPQSTATTRLNAASQSQQPTGAIAAHVLNARQEYANLRNEGNGKGDPARTRSPTRPNIVGDEVHTPPFAKSLMQQLDDDDPMAARGLVGSAYSSDVGSRRSAAYSDLPPGNQHYYPSPADDPNLRDRLNGLSLGNQPTGLAVGMTGFTSPTLMTQAFPRTQNPADQNPPINTLYVGGLPAVQPSLVGPLSAAHLEECLRNAFSRCPGFRRLCFRQKSNGPMCFVEFDDVHYASRALSEMYGNTLNGLVKGGIRLSFSKNPLGVRNGSMSTAAGPLSPTSAAAYLPPADSYVMAMSTSPAPSNLSSGSGNPRRPSDASYYAGTTSSSSSGNSAPRSMTPRSNMSPTSMQGANAFSPFGYAASNVAEM